MRRHLKPQPTIVNLSVEEEAILGDEQNQVTNELVALDADITRIMDSEDVLSDVGSVIAQVPEVGAIETDLVCAVSDMAVAGSDASPEEILPVPPEGLSAESFVSTMVEQIKKLWDTIVGWLNKMWESIKSFFTRSKVQNKVDQVKAEKIVKKEQEIEQQIKDVNHGKPPTAVAHKPETHATPAVVVKEPTKQETPKGMFKFKHHKLDLAMLSMPNGKVPEGENFVREVKRCFEFAVSTFDTFGSLFLASTKYLLDLIHKIDEDNADELMEDYIQFYVDQQSTALRKLGVDTGNGETESYMREEYLGDLCIKVESAGKIDSKEALFQRMIKLRRMKFSVTVSDLRGKPDELVPLLPLGSAKATTEAMKAWNKDLEESVEYSSSIEVHSQASSAIKTAMQNLIKQANQGRDRDSDKTKAFHKTIMMLQHVVQSSMARDAALFVDLPRRVHRIRSAVLDYLTENNLERAQVQLRGIQGDLKSTQDVDDYFTK